MSLDRFKTLSIAVGIPSNGMWVADFATSFCNMIVYFQTRKVGEYKHQMLQTISSKGSILPKQRKECVDIALKQNVDYLLWLDSDHTFPRFLLHELIAANKDIIGINCTTKSIPSNPTARAKPGPGDPQYGNKVYSDNPASRLEKVWRLGCGIMLVKMDVFRKVGSHVFDVAWREDVQAYQGEDWSMCDAFERAGYDIWVDHKLSLEVGHVGFLEYNHSLVGEVQVEEVVDTKEAA